MASDAGPSRHTVVPAVHLLLVRSNRILLLRRANTGFYDGSYSVPAGHVEPGESATAALVREVFEEIGVTVSVRDLGVGLVMHRKSGSSERVDFFFSTGVWEGEIVNAEPGKCDDVAWFSLTDLPAAVVPYVRAAIDLHRQGCTYAEFGWDGPPDQVGYRL